MKSGDRLVKTSCQLCHLSCGMNVYVENDKIIKVEGMPEHPLNQGELCPKGEAAIDYVYSPDRLKYPMKKDGGKWRRITWDEALDTIASKMTGIRETYGAKAFGICIGMPVLLSGSSTVGLIRRFCYAFGSPNCFSVESMCYRCRIIAYLLTFGRLRVADPENSRCIIVWGHNATNSNPMLAKSILNAKDKGATLIVIDPRRIPLAKVADIHLQPIPDTDCALILGLINVIISQKLYDEEFVTKWTFGFDRIADHVKLYTPAYVEKITAISASMIEKLAYLYATNKPACIVQGTNALDQHATGIQNSRGISILQALTGNIDVPGGFIRGPRLRENPIEMPVKLEEPALGQNEYPIFYGVFGREFGEGQTMLLSDTILSEKPYPIKMVIVVASNPLLTWPDSLKVAQAFKKLDFLVVMDQFMSETAQLADIVLPAATFLERTELSDYYSLFGFPYVMLRKKVIEYEECWPDLKFWFSLAQKLGYKKYFPWKTVEECIDYVLMPSGLSVKKLTEEKPAGVFYNKVKYKEYEVEGFRTPSGKVELYSETLAQLGYSPMPTFIESPETPRGNPKLAKEYPLILTTGARMLEFCHSQHRNIPKLRQKNPQPQAEISAITAAKYGIADGDTMTVTTKRGSIEINAKVTEDIVPGVVCIPHGWAEANVNILTTQEPSDPIIGYPALKSLLCRITKRV
jgi:formate dehydrogenase (coenzyme F420) alpha subunit